MKNSTENIIVVKAVVLGGDRVRIADINHVHHVVTREQAEKSGYVKAKSPKFFKDGQGTPHEFEVGGLSYVATFRKGGGRSDNGFRICAFIRCASTGNVSSTRLLETLDGQFFKFDNYYIYANGRMEELWDASKDSGYDVIEDGESE